MVPEIRFVLECTISRGRSCYLKLEALCATQDYKEVEIVVAVILILIDYIINTALILLLLATNYKVNVIILALIDYFTVLLYLARASSDLTYH